MKKITTIITTIILIIFGFALIPTNTYATTNICERTGLSDEIRKANGCPGAEDTDITAVIVNIINAIVGALGIVAVIVIIIGGVNYMTSTGDAGKIEKAKKTILYATIGLVICALAFAIVNFAVSVVNNVHESGDSSSEEEDDIKVF